MRFVNYDQKIFREIIHQGKRRFARRPSRKMARVILDAGTVAHLLHHFQVVAGPLFDALRFQQTVFPFETGQLLIQFCFNIMSRPQQIFPRGDKVRGRINRDVFALGQDFAGHAVDFLNLFDFIAKQRNPDHLFIGAGRIDFDHVAAHPELAASERHVIAIILDFDQFAQDVVPLANLPLPQRQHHTAVFVRRAEAIDAGHAGHDNHVAPFKQGTGCRVAQFVDLVVDRGIFFDIGIGSCYIGFRLVIIIVTDEVLHRILREELLEFAG